MSDQRQHTYRPSWHFSQPRAGRGRGPRYRSALVQPAQQRRSDRDWWRSRGGYRFWLFARDQLVGQARPYVPGAAPRLHVKQARQAMREGGL